MLLTVYTLLEMLRSGLVQTPFIRYFIVANTKAKKDALMASAWQILLLFTLVTCAILLPFILFYNSVDSAFSVAKPNIIIWLIASLPYQITQWQLQAKSHFKKLAIIRILFPLCFTALLLYQTVQPISIINIALYYATIQFGCGIIAFILGWLNLGNWHLNLKVQRQQLTGFGKYSMVTMVGASLLRSSDQFIIAAWLGPTAVALYSIPQKLIEAIEIPVRSFASVAVPKATALFVQNNLTELRLFFYKQCALLTIIIFPLILGFLIFPHLIINLMGGKQYQQSALLLQIFCFYAVFIPLDRYCGILLDAVNQPQKNTLKVIIMLTINVLGDLAVLYLGLGLYGVAAVSTVTFSFGVFYGWIQLRDILQKFSFKLFWVEGVVGLINRIKTYPR
jgi:O-antigen/teichoic acid export membrane protein